MFDSNVTTGEIVIYSLMGLAVLGIIFALIWTKLIKPVNMSYSSNSMIAKNKLKSQVEKLLLEKKIKDYHLNINFRVNHLESQAVSKIVYGKKYFYLISDPMYWNVLKVKKIKNNYMTEIKKNKNDHALAIELNSFINGAKYLKKQYFNQSVIIIIPALNEGFENNEIDKIEFMKIDDLAKFISDKEQEEKTDLSIEEIKKIEQIIVKKKARALNNSRFVSK